MCGRRKDSRYRKILLVFGGWGALNAGIYLLFDLLERTGRSKLQVSDATVREFGEKSLVLQSNGGALPRTLRYRLLKPKDPIPGRKYPVVLFLHGAGQVGHDNRAQLKYLPEQMAEEPWRSKYPCFLVAPQCPPRRSWSDQVDALLAILEQVLKEHPADSQRIYLTGLSMGGFGSWSLAALHPELFGAVVPICGGGDPANGEKLANIPIWAVHGDADQVVPVEYSRRMVDAIRKAGGSPRYTELHGVGHNSWTRAYRQPDGVIAWTFRQINRHAARSRSRESGSADPPSE